MMPVYHFPIFPAIESIITFGVTYSQIFGVSIGYPYLSVFGVHFDFIIFSAVLSGLALRKIWR